MEEKLELTEGDCRRYYQLVQDKISPECNDSHTNAAVLSKTRYGEVEDLNLSFPGIQGMSNCTVLPKKVTLKYFEKDIGDNQEDEVEEFNEEFNGIQNVDGHYIMDDDTWSDYWDSAGDDIGSGISKCMLYPIQKQDTFNHNTFHHNFAQPPAAMVNGSIVQDIRSSVSKVIKILNN